MGDLKKLTEENYKNLSSVYGNIFNVLDGQLDVPQYELLRIEVDKLRKNGVNTTYFDNLLEDYKDVYDLRKIV